MGLKKFMKEYNSYDESAIISRIETLNIKWESNTINQKEYKELDKLTKIFENREKVNNIKELIDNLVEEAKLIKEELERSAKLKSNSEKSQKLDEECIKLQEEILEKKAEIKEEIKKIAQDKKLTEDEKKKKIKEIEDKKLGKTLKKLEDNQKEFRDTQEELKKNQKPNEKFVGKSKQDLEAMDKEIWSKINKCCLVGENLMQGREWDAISLSYDKQKHKYTSEQKILKDDKYYKYIKNVSELGMENANKRKLTDEERAILAEMKEKALNREKEKFEKGTKPEPEPEPEPEPQPKPEPELKKFVITVNNDTIEIEGEANKSYSLDVRDKKQLINDYAINSLFYDNKNIKNIDYSLITALEVIEKENGVKIIDDYLAILRGSPIGEKTLDESRANLEKNVDIIYEFDKESGLFANFKNRKEKELAKIAKDLGIAQVKGLESKEISSQSNTDKKGFFESIKQVFGNIGNIFNKNKSVKAIEGPKDTVVEPELSTVVADILEEENEFKARVKDPEAAKRTEEISKKYEDRYKDAEPDLSTIVNDCIEEEQEM